MSSGPVLQQPSRKNPVFGLIEQSSSRSPRTFRGALRRPPPFPLSSLSNANSWIAAMPANAGACRPPTSESSRADGALPRWSIEPPPEERRLRQRGYRIGERYGKPSMARRIRHEGYFESDLACADCANGAAGPLSPPCKSLPRQRSGYALPVRSHRPSHPDLSLGKKPSLSANVSDRA